MSLLQRLRHPSPGRVGGPLAVGVGRLLGTGRVRDAAAFGLHLAETALLTLIAMAAARWLSPDDPFGLRAAFPWPWLMPALLALRFGTVAGLLSGAMLAGAWFARGPLGLPVDDGPFPQPYFLGGLVLVLVCGQFSDVWHDRLRRVREVNHYLGERLAALTRSHFLLQLSHQRIEHELLVRPVTLRDLLGELRALASREDGDLAGATYLLRLLAQSCEIEVASMHALDRGEPRRAPIAFVGEPGPLDVDDPLVRAALELERLAHVQADQVAAAGSRYLAVAPIETGARERIGLLVVERMPFFALNLENLQLLTVLLGYWADGLASRRLMRRVIAIRPDCPPDFAVEVVRLQSLRRQADIQSSLVAFVFDRDPGHTNLAAQVRRMPRSLDLVWEIETPEHRVMVNLLALAGPAAVEGFLSRIDGMLRAQFDTGLEQARIGVQVAALSEVEPEWTLDDLLSRCRVPAPPQSAPRTDPAPAAPAR